MDYRREEGFDPAVQRALMGNVSNNIDLDCAICTECTISNLDLIENYFGEDD